VDGDNELTVHGGEPGGCDGSIDLHQSAENDTYQATFRVTDLCEDYSDEFVVTVIVGTGAPDCSCPFQGDLNGDGTFDAIDLNDLIDVLFFNATDPQDPDCPRTRGDLNASGVADAVDLNYMIDLLFFNGPFPVDPCP